MITYTVKEGGSVAYIEATTCGKVFFVLESDPRRPWIEVPVGLAIRIAWLLFKFAILAKLGRGTRDMGAVNG